MVKLEKHIPLFAIFLLILYISIGDIFIPCKLTSLFKNNIYFQQLLIIISFYFAVLIVFYKGKNINLFLIFIKTIILYILFLMTIKLDSILFFLVIIFQVISYIIVLANYNSKINIFIRISNIIFTISMIIIVFGFIKTLISTIKINKEKFDFFKFLFSRYELCI